MAYHIRGHVIDGTARTGLAGVRIEIWDTDGILEDLIAEARTDGEGAFEFRLEEGFVRELFRERRPHIFFRLFRDDRLIESSQESLFLDVEHGEITLTIQPEDAAAPGPGNVVHGTVFGRDGKPLAGARVTVFHQRIRSRDRLAAAKTAADGSYRAEYRVPADADRTFLLTVEASSRHLDGPIDSSPVQAQPDLQVDLSATPLDKSAFAVLLAAVTPLLDGLELTDIVESDEHKDLTFLAQEIGTAAEEIMRLTLAARLEAASGIAAAAYYAFLRQRAPAALPNPLLEASQGFALIEALVQHVGSLIAALTADAQQRVLETAVAGNIIGPQLKDEIPAIVARLQARRGGDLLAQPFFIGKPSLKDLLDVAQLPQEKQQLFADTLAANTQSMRNFWRSLGDGKHGFTAQEASAAERTLSVGALVKNHLPLIQELLGGFESGAYRALPDLARLSTADWLALVDRTGTPPNVDAAGSVTPAEVFARVVSARITRAYPTAALAARVASGRLLPEEEQAPLAQFFRNNPSLELVKHNLAIFVENAGDEAFAEIDAKDRPAVIANARKLQRVLRIVPKADAAETLLRAGIDSAVKVASMGQQQFFLKATEAGLSKREASRVYRAGAHRYASVLSIYTRFNRDAIGIWPQMIGRVGDLNDPIQEAVSRDQSLSSLFGSADYCEVDSCTSILSPAAYLCDLLLWLRNHPLGGGSALDVLDSRRPDIRHLLLNCPNTDTPLPYIDLVNELLADAISPPADPGPTINPRWKQTSADKSAQELRAAPEYFNQDAYVALAAAGYPHTLPYSVGLDELRTYLGRSGIALWQLRQALLPLPSPSAAQRASVAAERLHMSPRDEDLAVQPNLVPADTAWNVSSAPAALVSVPAFLAAAGISYQSLLELLQAGWVQDGLGVAIQGVNDTCDTSVQTLAPAPLDAGFLDRAHRFLRMWRRTGLKMWELDSLLRAPTVANGSLDQGGLAAIEAFLEVQDATRLPVDQQLAFFQDIDVDAHLDPDGTTITSLYSRVFLNPAVASVAPDADIAAIGSGGAVAQPALADHLAAIQTALGVSADDATMLFGLTDNQLTLANLSSLYRVTAMARAAATSIADLISLATLLDPLATDAASAVAALFASPATASGFIATARTVKQSGLPIDALVYLLTPPPWATSTQMTDTDIAAALAAVRAAILAPNGDVNGSVIAAVAANAHRPLDAPIANDVTATILQQLVVNGQPLLTLLTDAALGDVFTPLTVGNFPDQFLAIQLFDKAALLVRRLRLVNSDFGWLLANAGTYGGFDPAQAPVQGGQAAIPLSPLLATLLLVQLARLFTSAPPSAPIQTLYDLIAGISSGAVASEADAQAALATITGWQATDIAAFATAMGATFPADYSGPALYDRLRRLDAFAATAGASGAQLADWAAPPADEPAAQASATAALGALKARFPDNRQWLAVAPDIMNPMRERRSDALQAYLIARRDGSGALIYGDANGLFDHFLIDVQMSSCEQSTRVIQAYIAVQIFVERCLMNLEAPAVVVNLAADDTWNQWQWMKRYRIWQANREVFLYPENWLIESQRPNRTEVFQKLEQDVRQNDATRDYLETTVLAYIDGLDTVANLFITGTCQDPVTRAIHVVGRTAADPPTFYHRSLVNGAWTGWVKIPLDIKAHHAVPGMYRGRLCLFWPDIKVANEPRQDLPAPQPSSSAPSQETSKYVSIGIFFSILRNGNWAPAQAAKGKLFDRPLLTTASVSDSRAVEALYTLKIQQAAAAPGFGASLFIDVFRLGEYVVEEIVVPGIFNQTFDLALVIPTQPNAAIHIGRAVFDGRISDLELRNLGISVGGQLNHLLAHAQTTYGADARPLLPLPDAQADPDLAPESGMIPQAGALVTLPAAPGGGAGQTAHLVFSSVSALQTNGGPLLTAAPLPFRVLGPSADLSFDPSSYFFFQDSRRSYHVESVKYYWEGSAWSPVVPSNAADMPFELRYVFHRFYHPFPRLFWHQLGSGGFPLLYDRPLQLNPDTIDPSGADTFSFQVGYHPITARVTWDRNEVGQDREFLDFRRNASYSTYNWELFFHVPLFIAELLSQNQKFEDALAWFHYIFDPTRPGVDPAPKRFWIPKPLYDLTSAEILAERINNLLIGVNNGDPTLIAEVESWRTDPFDPFLLADQRPVAYMKRVVMSYLDNLIAWADNLFASDSREALSEATLLYVIAAEILGPQPTTIRPPSHADDSYDQLEPKLDAFANAMVDIENVIGGTGGGGSGGGGTLPTAQTFYFKIPPNDTLLGYWGTVADRLFKLRHCQNIEGVTRQLALFDPAIDPGLLIRAQAAGVDIGSVLSDLTAALPAYRFTALYTQTLDFVNAVRAYGALLLGAIEKSDGAALAMLQQTTAQQLLDDGAQVLDWQRQQAEHALEALQAALRLAEQKRDFNRSQSFANPWEITGTTLHAVAGVLKIIAAVTKTVGAVAAPIPLFTAGAAGFGGTPVVTATEGGENVARAGHLAGLAVENYGDIAEVLAGLANTIGSWQRRKDNWDEAAREAEISIDQTNAQIAGAELAIQIAQANQDKNDEQIANIQKQIDFLTDKFTSQQLYDWMVGSLSAIYFQSYKLAYKMCKQLERCYQFELGIPDSSFIQFGYWDSLRKGLLAGETLNHDLRLMQSSYLELNPRRFEMSRFVSLAAIHPAALSQLLTTGACDFDLPESLFDNDYPGHYNRRLVRVSVTVVYPNPGKFDNVKGTLTLTANKVRVSTDLAAGYAESPLGSDSRFVYNYAAVPQRIALGNAQDDPGLFVTAISSNIADQRYLPFENAGAVSSWHFEMPAATNDIDRSAVGDVVLHLYYTALDGGDTLRGAVEADNSANLAGGGVRMFSIVNEFAAPAATSANPYPVTPWKAFLAAPAPGSDQLLTVSVSPSQFPAWTRGRTITISEIAVVSLAWTPGDFVIEPQAPLPGADLALTPLAGLDGISASGATINLPPNTPPGSWSFKLRRQSAGDFRSLRSSDIGDLLLFVTFQVS